MAETGRTNDWKHARQLMAGVDVPTFLSGGIQSENVRAAIKDVRPYGIDLCSGVESAKGARDRQMLNLLMQQVRIATTAIPS